MLTSAVRGLAVLDGFLQEIKLTAFRCRRCTRETCARTLDQLSDMRFPQFWLLRTNERERVVKLDVMREKVLVLVWCYCGAIQFANLCVSVRGSAKGQKSKRLSIQLDAFPCSCIQKSK